MFAEITLVELFFVLKLHNIFNQISLRDLLFTVLIFVYVPVAILGYLTYHDAIRDSILPSIQVRAALQNIEVQSQR